MVDCFRTLKLDHLKLALVASLCLAPLSLPALAAPQRDSQDHLSTDKPQRRKQPSLPVPWPQLRAWCKKLAAEGRAHTLSQFALQAAKEPSPSSPTSPILLKAIGASCKHNKKALQVQATKRPEYEPTTEQLHFISDFARELGQAPEIWALPLTDLSERLLSSPSLTPAEHRYYSILAEYLKAPFRNYQPQSTRDYLDAELEENRPPPESLFE